jgi:hypothetical protein
MTKAESTVGVLYYTYCMITERLYGLKWLVSPAVPQKECDSMVYHRKYVTQHSTAVYLQKVVYCL